MTKSKSKPKAKTDTKSKGKGKAGAKGRAKSTIKVTSKDKLDLGNLFNSVLQTVTANRQEINALDGKNGNHGDNMVENISLIARALQSKGSQSPGEALGHASQVLQSQGRGGTSQYYAQGLGQAAEQFRDRPGLTVADALPLVQTLLGAIPSEGHPQEARSGGSVLDQVIGLVGGGAGEQPADDKPDLGDVLETLLPAGLSYLQAKQSGAGTTEAAGQALVGALMGGRGNPLQTGSPRAAAGGLVAQGLLQALLGKK